MFWILISTRSRGTNIKPVHPTQIVEYTDTIVKLSPYINAIFLQMEFFDIHPKQSKTTSPLYLLTTGK